MSDKAWKACERRVAKYIGGERVPVTGRQRGDAPDIQHNWLVPEVKYRARLPCWLHDAMNQAKAAQVRPGQLPCVILCEKGKAVGRSFFICELEDARDHWL